MKPEREKTVRAAAKVAIGISSIFGSVAGWHAVMPLSECWLMADQLAACIVCSFISGMVALVLAIID